MDSVRFGRSDEHSSPLRPDFASNSKKICCGKFLLRSIPTVFGLASMASCWLRTTAVGVLNELLRTRWMQSDRASLQILQLRWRCWGAPMLGARSRGVNRAAPSELVADEHCRYDNESTADPLVVLGPRKPPRLRSLSAVRPPCARRHSGATQTCCQIRKRCYPCLHVAILQKSPTCVRPK